MKAKKTKAAPAPEQLYYHKTDGGAEYLFDTFIECENGHKEGVINDRTKYAIRLDGSAALLHAAPELLSRLEKGEAIISGLEAAADNAGLDLDEVRAWWADTIPVILKAGGKLR